MPEAELRIRPRMVGSAEAEIDQTRHALRRLSDEQDMALREGRTDVERLEQKYNQLEAQMHDTRGATRGMRSGFSALFGVAAAGMAAFHGGRTFLDLTVGASDDMNRRKRQLNEIFDDANAAMARSRELTREVASMSLGDAVQGMQSLGVKAGGSAERAGELVKLGKALEQLNPEQGFQGAVLAIKELASGETRSVVDRFNLSRSAFPDRSEAEKMARERGTTIQNVFFEALNKQLEKRGGVEKLLQIDRESLRGQMQMLETAGRDLLRTVGDEALPEVTEGVNDAAESLRSLADDPEFKEAAKDFGEFMGDAAKSIASFAPKLIKKIPSALQTIEGTFRTVKDFYDSHSGLIKTAFALWAGNKILGGAPGRAASGLVGRAIGGGGRGGGGVVGRALGGGKCCQGMSDAADTLGDVAKGAKGAGKRGFLQKALFSGGSAASFTEATMAAITPSAIGSLAAAAVPVAVGAFGLQQWVSAQDDPTKVDKHPNTFKGQTTRAIIGSLEKGKAGKAKKQLIETLGGAPGETFTGKGGQSSAMESVQARLSQLGYRLDLEKGQKFRQAQIRAVGGGLGGKDLSSMPGTLGTASQDKVHAAERFNRANIQNLNVQVPPGTKNPRQFGRETGEGIKEALNEETRKQRAKR